MRGPRSTTLEKALRDLRPAITAARTALAAAQAPSLRRTPRRAACERILEALLEIKDNLPALRRA